MIEIEQSIHIQNDGAHLQKKTPFLNPNDFYIYSYPLAYQINNR